MWIMVSGPYGSGAKTQKDKEKNLAEMNKTAYEVFKKGHTPMIGVNMALPIIQTIGTDHFDEIMMPVSLSLCDRCDAVIRIGGPSLGAEQEVNRFKKQNKPIFYSIDEIPGS